MISGSLNYNQFFAAVLGWVLIIEASYIWCSSDPLFRRWLYKKQSIDTNMSMRVDKPRQDNVKSAIQCSVYCMEDHRCIFFQVCPPPGVATQFPE